MFLFQMQAGQPEENQGSDNLGLEEEEGGENGNKLA